MPPSAPVITGIVTIFTIGLTFRERYQVSYTYLATLNFLTCRPFGTAWCDKVAKLNPNSNGRVPVPTLERLATYLRFLIDLEQSGVDTISSAEVERQTGINAAQFRKDLSVFYPAFGEFGKPGVGYNVPELKRRIARILKIDSEQRIILVGAGNLGSALVGYPGLKEHHFNLVAVFDNNAAKIGQSLFDLVINDVRQITEVNAEVQAQIAILAVPASSAQHVAEVLVGAGIRAILNFAPVLLRVPSHVFVRNVSFLQELAVLSYHLSAADEDEDDSLPGQVDTLEAALGGASSASAPQSTAVADVSE